jgi:hypothetical protein
MVKDADNGGIKGVDLEVKTADGKSESDAWVVWDGLQHRHDAGYLAGDDAQKRAFDLAGTYRKEGANAALSQLRDDFGNSTPTQETEERSIL